MRTSSRAKPVGAVEKVLLEDRIEQFHRRPLHDLVFKSGDRDRPLSPVFLVDIDPPQRLRTIRSARQLLVQVAKILNEAPLVVDDRQRRQRRARNRFDDFFARGGDRDRDQACAVELAQAVAQGDLARLTKVPGIGKKTAERLVVELKEKLVTLARAAGPARAKPGEGALEQLRAALVNLGYRSPQADGAVDSLRDGAAAKGLDELLREALKLLRG